MESITSPRLAVNQKHSGLFVQVAFVALPFPDALADDEFVVTGEVTGDAYARGRVEVLAEVLQHGVVAEGRFDEQLRLVVGC